MYANNKNMKTNEMDLTNEYFKDGKKGAVMMWGGWNDLDGDDVAFESINDPQTCDNCPLVINPGQENEDGDGIGGLQNTKYKTIPIKYFLFDFPVFL
jgi:hypothetical protein